MYVCMYVSVLSLIVHVFQLLLSLYSNKDIASATVIRVDLPFKPDSLVAFLALTTDISNTTNTTSTTGTNTTTNTSDMSKVGILKNGNGHVDETDYHTQIQSYIQQCQQKLHYYLIPTYIHIVPSSLLTTGTNGATGKSAGGGLGGGSVEGGGESLQELALKYYQEQNTVGPRNATEAQIELIWREQVFMRISCI